MRRLPVWQRLFFLVLFQIFKQKKVVSWIRVKESVSPYRKMPDKAALCGNRKSETGKTVLSSYNN
jgi:hypothetical protein